MGNSRCLALTKSIPAPGWTFLGTLYAVTALFPTALGAGTGAPPPCPWPGEPETCADTCPTDNQPRSPRETTNSDLCIALPPFLAKLLERMTHIVATRCFAV